MDQEENKLNPEQRRIAEALFSELERLPPDHREKKLDETNCDSNVRKAVESRLSAVAHTLDEASAPGEEQETLETVPQTQRQLRRIGNYSIKRLIGTGGMGQVYEAMQEHPRRSVALKVMRASIATDKGESAGVVPSRLLLNRL